MNTQKATPSQLALLLAGEREKEAVAAQVLAGHSQTVAKPLLSEEGGKGSDRDSQDSQAEEQRPRRELYKRLRT